MQIDFLEKNNIRAYGETRYKTPVESVDAFKKSMNIEKFDTVVITTGTNYPDVLTGCYLAKKKNAPILLVNDAMESMVKKYLVDNFKKMVKCTWRCSSNKRKF